jgi:hypothetical protein
MMLNISEEEFRNLIMFLEKYLKILESPTFRDSAPFTIRYLRGFIKEMKHVQEEAAAVMKGEVCINDDHVKYKHPERYP